MTIPDTSSHIDENQESTYLEDFDQDSISPQNFELDKYQPISTQTLDQDQEAHQLSQVEMEDTQPTQEKNLEQVHKCLTTNSIDKLMS